MTPNRPPLKIDPMIAALGFAVCDLLTEQQIEFNALLDLISEKGLATSDEVTAKMKSIASFPPEKAGEMTMQFQGKLRSRMEIRFAEIRAQMQPRVPNPPAKPQ